jgi:ribonuclease HI
MSELKKVIIFTDGACIHNPGPGGYGVVLMHKDVRKELSGGFRLTTNNRMEIMAAIVGLEALKCPCEVMLYSDSQYLVDSTMKGWALRWREKKWMRTPKEKARNADLWARLLDACALHQVTFEWVRGHAGNAENERCDALSVRAAQGRNLPADAGYEKAQEEGEPCRATKQVTIYTRGVTSVSGRGGYGAILLSDNHRKELSGTAPDSSNNRMDILAAIAALRALKFPCRVTLYNTNTYLTDAIKKGWAQRWRTNGWHNSEKRPTPHTELWEELLGLCAAHEATFEYLRFDGENVDYARCDVLAHAAAREEVTEATDAVSRSRPS